MMDEETKPVEEPKLTEEPKPEVVEEPKQELEGKITVPPKKKEKDPKKVAQGKRLAQISEKAKREKMRREIEEESQIDFSVNYNTLLYFGVPSIVFAGMYLYFSNKNSKRPEPGPLKKIHADEGGNPEPPKQSPPKIKHKNVVSLFD